MSRRYYKTYRRSSYRGRKYSNSLSLTKTEKQIFQLIFKIIFVSIKLLIYIITAVCKGIWKLSRYIRKIRINQTALEKEGYSLDEIMNLVYTITPRQFEVLVAELFKITGKYDKVEITPPTHDYGRDVILTKYGKGGKEVTFVEVKHFAKKNMVGREICQKLLGSCQMFNVEKAIVITTGRYHKNAQEVADKVDNLKLMDISDIEKMILSLESSQMSRIIMRTLNSGL